MERRVVIVVDLGFGDAGKGTVVDALVRATGAHTVIRFNGGAQAGHNVVTTDGRHHTFAQFGAGTLVPGVRTHLSSYVVVHPTALLVEARHLEAVGVTDALARLTISEAALVTTPVHQAAARLRELARGEGRHGSCGVGVGETVQDSLASAGEAAADAVRARDLRDPRSLRVRLIRQQARKRAELGAEIGAVAGLGEAAPEVRALEDPAVVDAWIEALEPLRRRPLVVGEERTQALLRQDGAVIFEGAQGVLLDEWSGFHPHTTWSTCTFANAQAILADADAGAPLDRAVTRLGVLRTYTTRHGAGPLPTETPDAPLAGRAEPHNQTGPWQGAFRRGWFDAVLARYALSVSGGVDALAVTHLDALAAKVAPWQVCDAYRIEGAADPRLFAGAVGGEARLILRGPPRDLAYAAALTRSLAHVRPVYRELARAGESVTPEAFVRWVEDALGVRVRLASFGPTAADKTLSL